MNNVQSALNPFTVGFILKKTSKSTKHSSNYKKILLRIHISLPELPGSKPGDMGV
jgi:hypothetical protein